MTKEDENAILVHLEYIREKVDVLFEKNDKQDKQCRSLHSDIDRDMANVKTKTNIFMTIISAIMAGVVGLVFFLFERK